MRLSQSLETEESKRQEKADEYVQWRHGLCVALAAIPLIAYNTIRYFYDLPFLADTLTGLVVFLAIVTGVYLLWRLPPRSEPLPLTFPHLDPSAIFYTCDYPLEDRKLTITSDEIWLQNLHTEKLWQKSPSGERRIAKCDITRIEKKAWRGDTFFNLYYRTSQGVKKLSLRRERDDELEDALHANVNLAEAPA